MAASWIARRAPLCLLLLLLASPGSARAQENAALAAFERAAEGGQLEAAAHHLARALEQEPAPTQVLARALELFSGDPEAHALWSLEWARRGADADGRIPSGRARQNAAHGEALAKLVEARVNAIVELERFADEREGRGEKAPEEQLVARWARRTARDLARGLPAVEEARNDSLGPRLELGRQSYRAVVKALQRALSSALSKRDAGLAVRLARVLRGLGAQARFKDLKGDRPSVGDLEGSAGGRLADARRMLREREEEPWTVEDLEWFTQEEAESFTRLHDGFEDPGLAVSPREWYRIETDCGAETLLGVARTIEDHHDRLVNWYGHDPFIDIPGLVRIVPESWGLEAEGAPFFWAGGFQGGNTTTMRFSMGTIEGLGHGLTHELTHRFDGAIFPGQPAWLTEGKAVWTGSAYGHSSNERFVEGHCNFGTMSGALIKGYGGEGKLRKLVDGTLEEYRDNYVAGYALYVFLTSWRRDARDDGERIFADQLDAIMRSLARFRGDAGKHFDSFFCDGEDGRPASFGEFSGLFGRYLRGFHWKTPEHWRGWYTSETQGGGGDPVVYDEPTWGWERQRAEPYFGQVQARQAALLLAEVKKERDAIRAFVWALAVDGPSPLVEPRFLELLRAEKKEHAAWCLQRELSFPDAFPARRPVEPAPFLNRLTRTTGYLERASELAGMMRAGGAPTAAAALEADVWRIASWLGVEAAVPPAVTTVPERAPFDSPGRALRLAGWAEDELGGFEERRHAGLWYQDDRGDLHVGRQKPRTGTGQFDRRAHQRDAFAYSRHWALPGTYRIKTRIQFTTSYVSGAVVFGHDRRDRFTAFTFRAGDYMVAIGESEEEPTFEEMSWGLNGRFERDGPLRGANRGGEKGFGKPRTSFALELLVDGSSVRAFIEGDEVGIYHTADGSPIEGQVGFATSMGAIRVQEPVIERLDRGRLCGTLESDPTGLDVERGSRVLYDELVNREVCGLAPSSNGTLLLWFPAPEGDEIAADGSAEEYWRLVDKHVRKLAQLVWREAAPQAVSVALPAGWQELKAAQLELLVSEEFGPRASVIWHEVEGGESACDEGRRWLMFVDSSSIARFVSGWFAQSSGFDSRLQQWLTVFRDVGRPLRDLPEVKRLSESEEEGLGEDE